MSPNYIIGMTRISNKNKIIATEDLTTERTDKISEISENTETNEKKESFREKKGVQIAYLGVNIRQ